MTARYRYPSFRTTRNTVAAMALAAVMTAAAAVNAQQPTPVRTAPVTSQRVQEHRRVTGSLQAVARSSVASQEAGQILEVLIDEGMTVAQGDVIAKLDARRLEAQLAEAKASLERAESDLHVRKSELEFAEFENQRMTNLAEGQVASRRETMAASTDLAAAEARVSAAERAIREGQRRVELLEIRLDDMQVRAPYDARVVSRHVDIGEWVEPGAPIVTLVSTGSIEARLEVPERYAGALADHAELLHVEVVGVGRSVESSDIRVIPDVDPQARIFRVVLTLDNDDNILAPGMSVIAWVPTNDEAEHLTVPKSAVVRSGGEAHVYRSTQSEDGVPTAARTPVTVLFDWNDRVVIAAEKLHEGDEVIVEGNERIMPGAQLALNNGA